MEQEPRIGNTNKEDEARTSVSTVLKFITINLALLPL